MQRIPPSQKVRQRIGELLESGTESDDKMTTTIVRLGVEHQIQAMLEEEAKEDLGRDRAERRGQTRKTWAIGAAMNLDEYERGKDK